MNSLVQFWPNFYDKNQIKEINDYINKNYDDFESSEKPADNKKTSVKIIKYGKMKHLLSNMLSQAYHGANVKFGYTTFGPFDNEGINLNTYNAEHGDKYDWHIDSSIPKSPYDIKLTILINLSLKPFEGGQFQLFDNGKTTQINQLAEPGNIIMFKSYLHHRVLPVTSGERITLAIWILGPKFT